MWMICKYISRIKEQLEQQQNNSGAVLTDHVCFFHRYLLTHVLQPTIAQGSALMKVEGTPTLVQPEISQQLFDGLSWNLVQTFFMSPSGWTVKKKLLLLPDFSSSATIRSKLQFVQYFDVWPNTCKTSYIPICLSCAKMVDSINFTAA